MDSAAQILSFPEVAVVDSPLPAGDISSPVAPAVLRDVEVFVARQPTAKRILDVALASTALVILAPVLALLLAAVALDTGASPVFVQVRTGRGGEPVWKFKLRTL